MKVIGDVTVQLPFTIDYCAKGPDVDPLSLSLIGKDLTIFFPPSMSEGTDGKSFFDTGWAWWTGTSLRVLISEELTSGEIRSEDIRAELVGAINEGISRFLNACRLLFHRPDIFPVQISGKELQVVVQHSNGDTQSLPESSDSFFFQHIPSVAPLEISVNATTLSIIQDEMDRCKDERISQHIDLDAEWLESLGESGRAAALRTLSTKISEGN